MNTSEMIAEELLNSGYSHCFYLAGGNIMHLIAAFSNKFVMVPVLHEVTATIAVDSFNEISSRSHFKDSRKAFALVTVGPGLTQAITGIVGSYIDGRELLVIGGQVKSGDLKNRAERQKGMQEVDGVSLVSPYTKIAKRVSKPISREEVRLLVSESWRNRKGPVFLEICLDIQGTKFIEKTPISNEIELEIEDQMKQTSFALENISELNQLQELVMQSSRPILLLGGGVSLSQKEIEPFLEKWGIPVATTWNAADRIASSSKFYAGRPNWWGQRWANLLVQQCDLLIVVGSSLGYHQTGFNIEGFAPRALIVHIDIDEQTLARLSARKSLVIHSDANTFLLKDLTMCLDFRNELKDKWNDWFEYVHLLRDQLPLVENSTRLAHDFYLNPYQFIHELIADFECELNIVPCSSGGAYTCSMQVIEQRSNDLLVSSKGLGSMGYGIPAAIGAAFSNDRVTLCIEGDGGVMQNIQDLGTIAINNLPIKLFILSNEGYASIRGTQMKYFKEKIFGCDHKSGVSTPNFELIAKAFGIEYQAISGKNVSSKEWKEKLTERTPTMFEVFVSPDQMFHPRIESKVQSNGYMVSNSLHEMYPELESKKADLVMRFLMETEENYE